MSNTNNEQMSKEPDSFCPFCNPFYNNQTPIGAIGTREVYNIDYNQLLIIENTQDYEDTIPTCQNLTYGIILEYPKLEPQQTQKLEDSDKYGIVLENGEIDLL